MLLRTVLNKLEIPVTVERDTVVVRTTVKAEAEKIGMGILNQTKIITACSEIARNQLKYGGGGKVVIERISEGRNTGLRVTFRDEGPGISDIEKAMQDGFSTGKSMGLGLPGTKRLVDQFDIKSIVGKGTMVTLIKWKNG